MFTDAWDSFFGNTVPARLQNFRLKMIVVDNANANNNFARVFPGQNPDAGYSLPTFTTQVFELLSSFNPQNFEQIFKDKLAEKIQEVSNFFLKPPYLQAYTYLTSLMVSPGYFDPQDQVQALKNITFEDLIQFDQVTPLSLLLFSGCALPRSG